MQKAFLGVSGELEREQSSRGAGANVGVTPGRETELRSANFTHASVTAAVLATISGPITPSAPTLHSQVSPPQETLPSGLLSLDGGSPGPLSDFSLSTSVFQESSLLSSNIRSGDVAGGGISERAGQLISAWLCFHLAGAPLIISLSEPPFPPYL